MDEYSDFLDDPLYNLEDNNIYEDDLLLLECTEELNLHSDIFETDRPLSNLEENTYEDNFLEGIGKLTLQSDFLETDNLENDIKVKNKVRLAHEGTVCNPSVSVSSSSDANPSGHVSGDEMDANEVNGNGKSPTATDETPVSTLERPVYVWTDDKIDDGDFEGFPLLSVDQTIRLGEVMVIMVCQGPIHRVEEIVTVLALNLRDPDCPHNHVFTEADRGDPPVTGSALYDFASPAVIQELQKLCEVEKYRTKKGNFKGRRNSEVYVGRDAVKEFLDDRESPYCSGEGCISVKRAAMFSFLAASLVKSGVKNRDAMRKLWSRSVSSSFFYYGGLVPLLSRRALQVLNEGFRPESKLLKTVLRMFLKKNFEPGVSCRVKGVLWFTLLTQTSYNEMKMVTLTHRALENLRDPGIKTLQKLDSLENRSSILALLEYYKWSDGTKYEPWSRMFDRKYWSNLNPKDHTSLATILMCIIEDSNKNIWKMKSVKPSKELKTKCRKIAKKLLKDSCRTLFMSFLTNI